MSDTPTDLLLLVMPNLAQFSLIRLQGKDLPLSLAIAFLTIKPGKVKMVLNPFTAKTYPTFHKKNTAKFRFAEYRHRQ